VEGDRQVAVPELPSGATQIGSELDMQAQGRQSGGRPDAVREDLARIGRPGRCPGVAADDDDTQDSAERHPADATGPPVAHLPVLPLAAADGPNDTCPVNHRRARGPLRPLRWRAAPRSL